MTKKDGIRSWADLYDLLRESYESNKDERNKLFNENFGCCKEDQKMSENCCCNKEKKQFCVVYTIGREERHVLIIAKDEIDAIHQVRNVAQTIISVFGLDASFCIDRVYQEC